MSVNNLSDHQFGAIRKKHHKPRTDADRVYALLSQDFPKEKLEWIHRLRWTGPKQIPLSHVDFEDERFWKAARDEEHVNHFRQMIRSGEPLKEVIVVDRPGKPTAMAPDAHHRLLAAKEEGLSSVTGYEGRANTVEGPWDWLHDWQFKDTTKDDKIRNMGS